MTESFRIRTDLITLTMTDFELFGHDRYHIMLGVVAGYYGSGSFSFYQALLQMQQAFPTEATLTTYLDKIGGGPCSAYPQHPLMDPPVEPMTEPHQHWLAWVTDLAYLATMMSGETGQRCKAAVLELLNGGQPGEAGPDISSFLELPLFDFLARVLENPETRKGLWDTDPILAFLWAVPEWYRLNTLEAWHHATMTAVCRLELPEGNQRAHLGTEGDVIDFLMWGQRYLTRSMDAPAAARPKGVVLPYVHGLLELTSFGLRPAPP